MKLTHDLPANSKTQISGCKADTPAIGCSRSAPRCGFHPLVLERKPAGGHDAQSLAGEVGSRCWHGGDAGAASCGGAEQSARFRPGHLTASRTSRASTRSAPITPLQRPDTLAGKDTLSDEEAAAFEASENTRLNRDLFDPDQRAAERRLRAASGRRRAVVQRVLVRARQQAHQGQAHVAHRRSARTGGFRSPRRRAAGSRNATRLSNSGAGDSYEDRPLADRCLHRLQLRPADDSGRLQQQRADPAGARATW